MTERTVLLVEDNHDDMQLMCEALADADRDIVVRGAANVAHAWTLLSELPSARLPALIVTDHHLPDALGHDLIARLRACPRCGRVPVVMISGDATRPLDLPATPWFRKPDTWPGWRALAHDLLRHAVR